MLLVIFIISVPFWHIYLSRSETDLLQIKQVESVEEGIDESILLVIQSVLDIFEFIKYFVLLFFDVCLYDLLVTLIKIIFLHSFSSFLISLAVLTHL